jgi:glyoxylase-like metal-dependent hydrolase (beta-lactamase superfamily II)
MENLHWRIGDVDITRVVEAEGAMLPEHLFGEATAEELERHASWLRPHFVDDDGRVRMSIHALCIASPGHRVVVDTCVGHFRPLPGFEYLRPDTPFLERLSDVGFARETVDTVICTHLHFDHVGWNTMLVDGEWVPTFPNARYVICREEWDHWSGAEASDYVATLGDAVRPVVEAGLADLVPPDHKVTDEIRLVPTAGHTPGHVSVDVESKGARAFVTGDVTHHPVQWAEPGWWSVADSDADHAGATRRRLVADLAGTDTLVIGTHYPPPCAGRLVAGDDGCRFVVSSEGDD